MSVIDDLTFVDVICKKYDKYDVKKHHRDATNVVGDDAFARLYSSVEADIKATVEKSEKVKLEKNPAAAVAVAVAMNAEIRRTKARLMEKVAKLQRLAVKKVKGLSGEELGAHNDLVLALLDRIQSILDGSAPRAKQAGG